MKLLATSCSSKAVLDFHVTMCLLLCRIILSLKQANIFWGVINSFVFAEVYLIAW